MLISGLRAGQRPDQWGTSNLGGAITVEDARYFFLEAERVKVNSIIIDLVNVSHEPGVALNFPIKDAKTTAAFHFVPELNPTLEISGNEHQHAATTEGRSGAEAKVLVSSFDWGAWGEIQARAVLKDRRTIYGHLRGERVDRLRLPKRASDSLIADGWKREKGIDKPDNDDSEPNPVGLPGCDGDGFTLYEEYRGFYEKGEHIEGSPLKKDFFILNEIGAEAEAGIWLFTDLTDLAVHKDLTREEFNINERVLNKNHAWAPHRVDQHGVFMFTNDYADGAVSYFSRDDLHGPIPDHQHRSAGPLEP